MGLFPHKEDNSEAKKHLNYGSLTLLSATRALFPSYFYSVAAIVTILSKNPQRSIWLWSNKLLTIAHFVAPLIFVFSFSDFGKHVGPSFRPSRGFMFYGLKN